MKLYSTSQLRCNVTDKSGDLQESEAVKLGSCNSCLYRG